MGQRISQEEIDEVRQLLSEGKSCREIYLISRLSMSSIKRIDSGCLQVSKIQKREVPPPEACDEHGKLNCVECIANRHRATGGQECPPNDEPDDPEMNERIRRLTAKFRRDNTSYRREAVEERYTIPVVSTKGIPDGMLEG